MSVASTKREPHVSATRFASRHDKHEDTGSFRYRPITSVGSQRTVKTADVFKNHVVDSNPVAARCLGIDTCLRFVAKRVKLDHLFRYVADVAVRAVHVPGNDKAGVVTDDALSGDVDPVLRRQPALQI